MMDIESLLKHVPNYGSYMSAEELDRSSERLVGQHPRIASMIDLGTTAGGRKLQAVRIGKGRYNALVYGFPNPEEPLGGLVIDFLTKALLTEGDVLSELDYTWYFINCIDPDGADLTRGYLKGPLTPINFTKNYYRTPIPATPEENFPYRYGDLIDCNNPTQETKALMKLMNGRAFHFISSLHVMKFGGQTYQVPGPCPEIYAPLQELAPLTGNYLRKRLGDMLAPGIQLAGYFTPAANYVRFKAQGLGPLPQITGAYVFEHARMTNPDVFMMVPECATWFDPHCLSDELSNSTLKDCAKYASRVSSETARLLVGAYKACREYLTQDSPFKTMIEDVVDSIENPKANVFDPDPAPTKAELNRKITIGQKVDTDGRTDLYRMFNIGAMVRTIDYETERGKEDRHLASVRSELSRALDSYDNALRTKYKLRHHPLQGLVAMNAGSLLYAAQYAKKKNKPHTIWH